MTTHRRTFLKKLGITAAAGVVLPSLVMCNTKTDEKELDAKKGMEKALLSENDALKTYSKEAVQLVRDATCIDMLGGYGDWVHQRNGMSLTELWESVPNSFTEKDYEFVKSCGINVFGWGDMRPSYEEMLLFMAAQNGIIASNPKYFERIDTKEKLKNINISEKIGMLITNQDSKHFKTLDDVNLFYGLGQRVSQLTYNDKNRIGCGAFEDVDSGITAYGKQVVERMNQVGMGVDVSHCGDNTTLGSIEASSKPVLITHGACRTIAKGVARAKTDEAIKAMAKTGGVIGMPILRFMISEKEPVSFDDFLNHIDHVAQLVGVEYVGIGSDQSLYTEDYIPLEQRKARLENAPAKYQTHTNKDYLLTIDKLNHPHRTYDIAEGLLKKGYKDEHIKMVLGDNFKRVLTQIFRH